MVRACYIQLERINFSALACECIYPIWDVHSYYVRADPHKHAFFTVGFPIHSASPHRAFIKIS